MKYLFTPLFFILLVLPVSCFAQSSTAISTSKSIQVIGRSNSTVNSARITLSDIAKIRSRKIADDEAIIALKKIVIDKSPKPGKSITLSANEVLSRLREEGVKLDTLGYAFPRVLKIERASRDLTEMELESVVMAALPPDGNSELIRIIYDQPIKVAPGPITLSASIQPSPKRGQHMAKMRAVVGKESPIQFYLPIEIREWVEVPVAKRPLGRGMIVDSYDVVMARADLSKLPDDTARDSEQIIGQEIKQNIGYGEVFRRQKLALPPVIEKGMRVTILYKTPALEATATGIALEDGIAGQRVRVRNESSKKTISGEVMNAGLVRVNP